MRERWAFLLAFLMLASPASALVTGSDYDTGSPISFDSDMALELPSAPNFRTDSPWIDSSLDIRVDSGANEVRVTVITRSLATLNQWQHDNGAIEAQKPASSGERLVALDSTDGAIDHRTFWMKSSIFDKLSGVPGVIAILDAQNSPEPYEITPFETPPDVNPESVRSGEIHGANDAWERGYTGEGMVIAVADTGVDFAHPDLNGTQARVLDSMSPYHGWPLMFDHNSMYYWLVDGDAYPSRSTWYADTSTIDYDNNTDGILDISGYNVTGVNASLSGEYHLGEHPDSTLRSKAGGDVPILVVDDRISGLYETVYPDINRDGEFHNDVPMRPGEETAGLDTNGDGLWDISGGLVYWVADGFNGVPYSEIYAPRHGYNNRIPGPGNLTLFMLESGSHGTLCASAVAAQGVISDGKVLGMAPNSTISSIGNHYSGGHALDGWRFIAEGYDGEPQTQGDQPHIGSFSFGYSSVDEAGADGYSLYLDWLTRIYNDNASYSVAIGNGGHGFGTAKVPGAAHGIFSVGAFSSRSSDSWGQSAPWSNRGPNVVGRMDPDIVSVGWSATGDRPLNSYNDANSAWSSWGGTSLATPIAAGLMALVAEAWQENLGDYPGSQEFRDFVLSTSDDRGYEPLIQGGGWFNASRAIATIEGDNGTWWASPAQWNSGTYQGKHRDANINLMHQGESQDFDLEFFNYAQSPMMLSFTPTTHKPLEHNRHIWQSRSEIDCPENSTADCDDSPAWGNYTHTNSECLDYSSSRPHLLIPLHITNNSSIQLPSQTTQLRARATIEYSAFDGNQDRSAEERVYLEVFRWTDFDGDGTYITHSETPEFHVMPSGEWTESSELEQVTYWWKKGPNAEVRVGLPFEDARDGLLLGVWNYNCDDSDEPVRIEIDWTAFGSLNDDWITVPSPTIIQANGAETIEITVSVPMDAESGIHQHGVLIETYELNQTGAPSLLPMWNWTLPIVTNVPWSGPFTLTPKPLDGNVSNQTLYDESWISGATRWDWRAESGDWRFLTVDWPAEWDTGGTAILDVDWSDTVQGIEGDHNSTFYENIYTDIDVLWLSETPHGYAEDDPDAYGDSTFYIESRSTNNYAGSGSHNWGTFTDTSREMFAVPAEEGVHQLVLHTALHGVSTNDNPLNVSVGYIAAEESGFQKVVTDWSEGSGQDSVHVVSTVPLSVESVSSYGWSQPAYYENETAYQDNAGDKMSASWWHNMTIENSTEIDIRMNSNDDADLDLFLFRDSDGDGTFSSGEEIARSTSSSSSESIRITDPEDGFYSVAVQGYSVPSGSVQFWIDVEVVGGDQLFITDNFTLSDSEISAIWPNGSQTLAGQVPSAAFQVNLSYIRPAHSGVWSGHIEVVVNGGISLTLPYTYELVELDPEITFVQPDDLTETNTAVPIQIHALDTGIGFRLDDLNWEPADNNTRVPEADIVEAIDTEMEYHNLTDLWNSGNHFAIPENVSFREVWINSTLPEVEQWHRYTASVTDLSNYSSQAQIAVSYDVTAPALALSDIPWITNQEYLTFSIHSESGASVTHSGTPVFLDESGSAEITIQLTEAEPRQNQDSTFYYVHSNSVFDIVVTDAAGNSFSRDFSVIYDPTPPSAQFVDLTDQAGYQYDSAAIANPVNLTEGVLTAIIPVDVQEWCFHIFSLRTPHEINECETKQMIPQANLQDVPGQSSEAAQYSINTSGLPDGDYMISLELTDWAENSATQTWLIYFDSTVPVVDWSISPGTESAFFDHRQGLSWIASEEVHVTFTIDDVTISERTSITGGALFELNRTGLHLVCLVAVDMTEPQENDNRFEECREIILDPSIYSTHVSANWDGGIMAIDEVEAILQRGPDQEIWWRRSDSEDRNLITPGAQIVTLNFDLQEGDNQFIIEIEALDHFDNYTLSIVRDTMPPVLTMEEVVNRTSTLETRRVISGTCEPNAPVMIWSEAESIEFNCNAEGVYEVEIEIPETPGTHIIDALTSDSANNENSATIEVLEQNWIDWALDDARSSGPMLWWFSLASIVVILLVTVPTVVIRRRRARADRLLQQGPDIEEILSEVESPVEESEEPFE